MGGTGKLLGYINGGEKDKNDPKAPHNIPFKEKSNGSSRCLRKMVVTYLLNCWFVSESGFVELPCVELSKEL